MIRGQGPAGDIMGMAVGDTETLFSQRSFEGFEGSDVARQRARGRIRNAVRPEVRWRIKREISTI